MSSGIPTSSSAIDTLVFAGGGLRGLAYVGCLRVLEDHGIIPGVVKLVGTSFGAIVAMVVSLGFSADELYDFVVNFRYAHIQDIHLLGFWKNFGLDTGGRLNELLRAMCRRKTGNPDLTFRQLFEMKNKRLVVAATCLNDCQVRYFSLEESPELSVASAVRMSASLPVLFAPVICDGMLYSDGGLLDNFPLSHGKPESTLGFCFGGDDGAAEISDPIKCLQCVCACVFETLRRTRKILERGYQVIEIDTGGISTLNLEPTAEQRQFLYQSGLRETSRHFANRYAKELLEELITRTCTLAS
ncbi:MAG: patatin-like phospholipase family protein [Sulfobacillus sp.]